MRRFAFAAVALGAFVIGVWLRPDAALALMALGVIFIVLERSFPRHRQRVVRAGFFTDCVHFLADELIAAALLAGALVVVLPVTDVVVPDVIHSATGRQPRVMSIVEALALAEVAGYWGHRATHVWPALWRFHRLHHSIEMMDWLAPNRRHPVDMAFARASVVLPLALLGFTAPVIAAHFAVKRSQGLLVHANIRLNAGWMTWLIATPEFHHWHHADHPEAYNKNFAGQLPVVDWLFRSLHLPRPAWPERYGCGVEPPEGYVAQLMWPFRPLERSAAVAAPTPTVQAKCAAGSAPAPRPL